MNIEFIIPIIGLSICCISSISCICIKYRRKKRLALINKNLKNDIYPNTSLNEINIQTSYIQPSTKIRDKYINELIEEYISKQRFVITVEEVREKYNNFVNIIDIQNLKKDIFN
jgi:hypothetical protein